MLLISLPTELICQIAFNIEDYADLLSFALAARLLYDILSSYIDYNYIACTFNDPKKYQHVWEHLSSPSSAQHFVENLSLFESSSRYIDSRSTSPVYELEKCRSRADAMLRNNTKIIRIPKACRLIQSAPRAREFVYTWSAQAESASIDHIRNALNTINHLPNLVSFEVQLCTDKYLNHVVEGLVAAQPVLKKMTVMYDADRRDSPELPASLFLDLDYTHLTNLVIHSDLQTQNNGLASMLISHTPNLMNLVLHLPYNIFNVLKHSMWPNLRRLELGSYVKLFPAATEQVTAAEADDGAEDSDFNLNSDSGQRAFLTSFLKRHPSLEHLYLPVWTQLANCFPTEDGLCPNVRAFQTSPKMYGHEPVTLHLPASLSRQLTHFSTQFNINVVPTISAMPNLDSCTLVMHMDQAKHIESVLRSASKITKLRIELLGEGMRLLSWIEKTVKVLLSHSPHLTQLLSLFDDLDVGQPMAKKLIHQLVTQIRTLKYTSGSMNGKRCLLRFDRGEATTTTTTYMGFKTVVMRNLPAFPSPDKDIVDLDDNLTSWGNFWG